MSRRLRKIELLFIGRIDKQKGIDILLEALNNFEYANDFHLTVIGDAVVDPVIALKSYKNVRFMGWQKRENVTNEIKKSDIVVIPSRWEGFGIVTLEAMKNSKMVLASNAGALPEIVVNKETGFVFQSDSVAELQSVLKEVNNLSLEDIDLMGQNGNKRYKNVFNYDKMVNQVMDVYKDILSN